MSPPDHRRAPGTTRLGATASGTPVVSEGVCRDGVCSRAPTARRRPSPAPRCFSGLERPRAGRRNGPRGPVFLSGLPARPLDGRRKGRRGRTRRRAVGWLDAAVSQTQVPAEKLRLLKLKGRILHAELRDAAGTQRVLAEVRALEAALGPGGRSLLRHQSPHLSRSHHHPRRAVSRTPHARREDLAEARRITVTAAPAASRRARWSFAARAGWRGTPSRRPSRPRGTTRG